MNNSVEFRMFKWRDLEMQKDPMIHSSALWCYNIMQEGGRRRRCGDAVSSTYEAVLHVFLCTSIGDNEISISVLPSGPSIGL